MSKARSTCKDWDFVSKGTEISTGRFLIEYFTPLTLGEQHQGALSDEDVDGVLGLLVDSEIVLSTRYGKTRVFINKTLSTETVYQQDLIEDIGNRQMD